MKIYKIIPLCIIVISNSGLSGQNTSTPKDLFVEAESYFLFEEFKEALPLYQRILREEPENYNVVYKVGICYLNDPYQKEKSISYLLKASEHINDNFKLNSYKEKKAPPETKFYLGQAYRVNGQINNAIKYYEEFKEELDPNIFDKKIIDDELATCKEAIKRLKDPIFLKLYTIEELNSRFADLNPVISGDGNTIIFTQELKFYVGVFISTKSEKGSWTPPYNLTPHFQLDGDSYSTGISYNGDEIFVYRSDDFDGNIYTSKLVEGNWQKLEKLNENINTKYWESHASPSPDGQYLYFTSNRKGGFGGLDVYRSKRLNNGGWGIAKNLGPVINSSFNEESPFVSSDGSKLFFSSRGHGSMGGYDIYVSKTTESGNWEIPVNMGYPLNTTDEDYFFCPVDKDNIIGLYSVYQENTEGLKDIFYVNLHNEIFPRIFTIKGKINIPVSDLLVGDEIVVSAIDSESGVSVSSSSIDSLGGFTIEATQGEYQLLIKGKGIKPYIRNIELAVGQENALIELPALDIEVAETGEDYTELLPKSLPKLEVDSKKIIMTDSSKVKFNIEVEEGSDLSIQTYIGKELVDREEYLMKNGKFTYLFQLEEGENKVVFTVRDSNKQESTREIIVYYTPADKEQATTTETLKPLKPKLDELASLTEGNLKEFIISLSKTDFTTFGELYTILITNSVENNYSVEDVNSLFSILLSQRSKEEFLMSLKGNKHLAIISNQDSIIKNSNTPIDIVKKVKLNYPSDKENINIGLIGIVPLTGSNKELLDYILSFDTNRISVPEIEENTSTHGIYKILKKNTINVTAHVIDLASTTVGLEQMYQNLLFSDSQELRSLLEGLKFQEEGINNSVDLINYLFEKSKTTDLSIIELVKIIENAKINEGIKVGLFKEALTNAASGELKLILKNLDLEKEELNNYTDILERILRDSNVKGYSRAEVYNLLIKMLAIDKVDVFIKELMEISEGQLKVLLSEIEVNRFSSPIEVIQYLLSEAPYYDFADSDLNNLLIRMLFERGIDNWSDAETQKYAHKLVKKRRISKIIVFSSIFVLLIIIFFRRRKKKRHESHESNN